MKKERDAALDNVEVLYREKKELKEKMKRILDKSNEQYEEMVQT